MAKYSMIITTNDEDTSQSRIIVEVNGVEVDILADNDGVNVEIKSGEEILGSVNYDWPE